MFKHLFLKARRHQTKKRHAICGRKLYTILGALRQLPGTSMANAVWPSWISSPEHLLNQILLSKQSFWWLRKYTEDVQSEFRMGLNFGKKDQHKKMTDREVFFFWSSKVFKSTYKHKQKKNTVYLCLTSHSLLSLSLFFKWSSIYAYVKQNIKFRTVRQITSPFCNRVSLLILTIII